MTSGKAQKGLRIVILILCVPVAVVLAVCLLPLPRHVDRQVSGIKIIKAGRETVEEVQVTISFDLWQKNYLFKSDEMKGTLLVSEPSGKEMRFEVNSPFYKINGPFGPQMEEGLYWTGLFYYNADRNRYEGAYMYWRAGFTDVRIEYDPDS